LRLLRVLVVSKSISFLAACPTNFSSLPGSLLCPWISFYKGFLVILLLGQTDNVYIVGDGFYSFLRSQSVNDFGVDVHINPLHVRFSSPTVVLGEILPKWKTPCDDGW
jgi:hypothetical protein